MPPASEVTQLLERAGQGEAAALDSLFTLVYGELRRLARLHLSKEQVGHTLNATALVNEACLRLLGPTSDGSFKDKQHFFAVASRAMRHILLDHARARLALKRGGKRAFVTLGDQVAGEARDEANLIALNDALTLLAQKSERLGQLVELRFFGGLRDEEIATVLGVSKRTVQREWRTARAFLSRQLQSSG